MRELERRASDCDRLAGQRDAKAQALSQEIATLQAEGAAASTRWADEKRALETELAAREQTLAERARRIADAERRLGDFEHMVAQRDGDAKSLRQEIAMLRDEADRRHGVVARPQDLARRADREPRIDPDGTRRAHPGVRAADRGIATAR